MSNQQLSTNTFGVAKWIVSSTASDGTHTTIGAALTSASSGDTIFIRPGTTYTENLTLKVGVDLVSFPGDGYTGNVIISGTCTLSTAGTVSISGIQLKTNGATNSVVVSGSAASILNLINCNINCSANTGISFTSSSASAFINCYNCTGDLGTTGIAIFSSSSAGTIDFWQCQFTNSGGSSTANTISAGSFTMLWSQFKNPFTSSSTASLNSFFSQIDTSDQNATAWTVNGSGNSTVIGSYIVTGTAVGATITSNAMSISNTTFNTSNASTITGAGTISFFGLSNTSGSLVVTTTTQSVAGTLQGLRNAVAPTSGMLGERITATGTSVATTSTTAKTIASIVLTPGIWDITASSNAIPTGGTVLMTVGVVNVSTTDNTLTGTAGVEQTQLTINAGTSQIGLMSPVVRATISVNTTYYLVCYNAYTSTTCPTTGKITATRVG